MRIRIAILLISLALSADPFAGEDYDAGLLDLGEGDDMFYWLFRSRNNPETDPLVLWLTGGPGCSSELAIFYENGPWWLRPGGKLERNEHSWNEVSNLLFVD